MMSNETDLLGAKQTEYRPDPPRLQAQRITAWVSIGLGIIGIIIGAIGLVVQNDPEILIISAMGAVPFIAGIFLLRRVSQKQGWCITTYENGFTYKHDGASGQANWAEVAGVWQRIKQDTSTKRLTAVFRIMLDDSTTLTIDQTYGDILELGKTLQHRTRDHRLPLFEQAYQQNKPLPFGTISIDQTGITYNDNQLPWAELEKVDFARHLVTIHKTGKSLPWAQVNVPQISNIFILTHMMSQAWGQPIDESKLY